MFYIKPNCCKKLPSKLSVLITEDSDCAFTLASFVSGIVYLKEPTTDVQVRGYYSVYLGFGMIKRKGKKVFA